MFVALTDSIIFDIFQQQEEPCGVGYQEERVDGECLDINECLTGKKCTLNLKLRMFY